MKPNADALDEVRGRLMARLDRRRCRSILCLVSGGSYLRLRELRKGLDALRLLATDDSVVLAADRLAPFAGKPGCCVIAVSER